MSKSQCFQKSTNHAWLILILPSLCVSRLLFFFVSLIPFIPSAAAKTTLAAPAATIAPVSSDYESVITDIDEESFLNKAGVSDGQQDVQAGMDGIDDCQQDEGKSRMLQLHLTFDCSSNLDRQQRKINVLLSRNEIKVTGDPEKGEDDLKQHNSTSIMTRLPIQIKQISRKSSDAASARSITSDLPASPTSLASLHSLESELERSVFPGKTLSPVRMTIETNAEEVPRRLETAGNLMSVFSQPKSQTREGSVQTVRLKTVDAECQTLREMEQSVEMTDKRSQPKEKANETKDKSGEKEILDPLKAKGFDIAVQTMGPGLPMQDDVTARVLLEHVGAIERENREKCLSR